MLLTGRIEELLASIEQLGDIAPAPEAVPENARTLALAGTWLGDRDPSERLPIGYLTCSRGAPV